MDGYIHYILNNAPRVLTQVDRDADSLSYGSCDRNYWHLKIRDFSSSILQQSALSMALLHTMDFEGNYFYSNSNVREWSIAALRYLTKIQLSDGSYNEYYPNEHGYPPTAFLLFSGCKTYQILNLDDPEILSCLKKTGDYLSTHVEKSAYNQEFAAITGLYLLYEITGEARYQRSCTEKLHAALNAQSPDGWFPEQGGADIGYSSVALDMLAEYYWHSKDETVREPMNRLSDFLQHFVHPDKTIGGEYGSRNTTYLMPNGFAIMELLGQSSAAAVNHAIFEHVEPDTHFMNSVDERYLAHYVLHSFLRALDKIRTYTPSKLSPLPCAVEHFTVFQDCGLITTCTERYFAVSAPSKGGIIKIFQNGREVYGDFGYRHLMKPGTISTTNWLDPDYKITYFENGFEVSGAFNIVKQKLQNPIYHLGLRICATLLGKRINTMIKKILLFSDHHEKIEFKRVVSFLPDQIHILDKIFDQTGSNPQLYSASNFSLRLVASGKFFSRTDLCPRSHDTFTVTGEKELERNISL